MSDVLASSGLMAPLDVARFALAYLLLALAPGYALATLARPRTPRIERLVLAVPCAYGLVAVCGLATALLRLPFDLPAYAALALPILAVFVGVRLKSYAIRRRLASLAGAATTIGGGWPHTVLAPLRADPWVLAPFGVALAQIGTIALIVARYIVPPDGDAVSHVMWTSEIARTHVYPIALLGTNPASGQGSFYPPVFHALSALVLGLAPMPAYHAVFYGALAVVALLPPALYSYVRVATGSARLGGLAAVAALAFEPLPFVALVQGLYPFIASLVIAPALAIVLRDALGRGDRRSSALAALLGAGLFYTHPTEFVTAALLALVIVPATVHTAAAWPRACGYGLVVAASWGAAALPALAAVHRTISGSARSEIHARHFFAPPARIHLDTVLHGYAYWVLGLNTGFVLIMVVVVAGIASCLARGRLLSLVAILLLLCAVYVDTQTYDVLGRVYALAFPWALPQRLFPTHYWIVLPLAAIGIEAIARHGARLLRPRLPLLMQVAAAVLLVLGLLPPALISARQTALDTHDQTYVARPDLAALGWLARHAPAGSIVVNDVQVLPSIAYYLPSDATLWLPALDGPRTLFWRFNSGPGSLDERMYLLRHIADAPLPADAARFVARYHIRYVFYGTTLHPGATRHLRLPRLLADPRLRLVYTSSARCPLAGAHSAAGCPATGTYVFALDDGAMAGGAYRGPRG